MGLVVVDAGIVIAYLDGDDAHHATATTALLSAQSRGDRVLLPTAALAEALVSPARNNASDQVLDTIERLPIDLQPITVEVARAAAELRARHGTRLRLPDALVVATAHVLRADLVLTTDRGWPDRERLGIAAEVVAV